MNKIVKKTKLNPEESKKIHLTFAKINLQWWINKAKSNPQKDYSTRIQFMKHRLERETGQRVKLKGEN